MNSEFCYKPQKTRNLEPRTHNSERTMDHWQRTTDYQNLTPNTSHLAPPWPVPAAESRHLRLLLPTTYAPPRVLAPEFPSGVFGREPSPRFPNGPHRTVRPAGCQLR